VESRAIGVGARWVRVDVCALNARALQLQSHAEHEIGVVFRFSPRYSADARRGDARAEICAREFFRNFRADLEVPHRD
jgi:hypothetical protein